MSVDVLGSALRDLVAELVREELAKVSAEVDYATIADYAQRRSISTSTVRAAVRDGRLAAVKVGRAIRIPTAAEIVRPIHRHRSSATDRARKRLIP